MMIKSNADVKEGARLNPVRNPMMQPFRETAINFQRLSRYAATPQLCQKILAPSANKPIVLGTRRSTLSTKVERVVLNALLQTRVHAA